MIWQKQGPIFSVEGNSPWMKTHAQIPVADVLDAERVRIYFGTRDAESRTSTAFLEVSASDPKKILHVGDYPVLSPGPRGAFDDCGAMPSCLVHAGAKKYLYYIGWNLRNTVPYQNSIGVAVSEDGGKTFARLFDGPIMDRTPEDPYFVVTPYILIENGRWRMWYCSCTAWSIVDGRPEPRYQIKYAESEDGIRWKRDYPVCIPYLTEDEANTRPTVIKTSSGYRMWYCFRSIRGYRNDPNASYRLGYAESSDGITWARRDELAGLLRSEQGWDSEMIAYPFVYTHGGRWYLLYNANGFGKTGFGLAVARDTASGFT